MKAAAYGLSTVAAGILIGSSIAVATGTENVSGPALLSGALYACACLCFDRLATTKEGS